MAGAYNMQKRFTPTAPEKGSFPLDHEGECKQFKELFMDCIRKNYGRNELCRVQAKDYLQCRMEKDLMAKESWSKLGFADLEEKPQQKT